MPLLEISKTSDYL